MAEDFEKQYNPADYEDSINKEWLDSGFFNPDNLPAELLAGNGKPYAIVLPPPNVTDKLHVGHAVMIAIEDLLIRYKRMNGFCALWIPGTDHAAIATQNAVEKRIFKATGKTRHDLGREKFLAEVNKFAAETQQTILNQIKKMGGSLDWSRLAFTLDEQRGKAVKKMFVEMYNDGVIYRGERVINWCPRCQSTLADDEVEYKEQTAKLYTFKYSKDFPIAISTTRPETKLGDTAVAVNPSDERYKKYVGSTFAVNFVGVPLKIKIIADRNVDMNFGTGALGVTPAHSMVDYQMAQKNELPMIKVIDESAKIHPGFGEYSGLRALDAREKIVERLREAGLLEKEEDISNNLSQCYRCDTAVEPIPSKQWFIDVDKKLDRLGGKSLKEVSIAAATSGEIKFTPERFYDQYINWMNNLHDWCISRQIWYGHRIPAWHQIKDKKEKIKNWDLKIYGEKIYNDLKNGSKKIETRAGRAKGDGKDWAEFKVGDLIDFSLVEDKTENVLQSGLKMKISRVNHFASISEMLKEINLEKIAPEKTEADYRNFMEGAFSDRLKKYGVWAFELVGPDDEIFFVGEEPPKEDGWVQDEDTLDTWFSSGMWTFSTLKWPDNYSPATPNPSSGRRGTKTGDLAKFHPTAVLETGFEILTLWVSRMILMSYYALGEKPFSNVYLHGMILDDKGKKMSKSKGNGIDPLEVIAKYGNDALRLALLTGTTPGNNARISWEKFEAQRNFINKLWNVSRYIIQTIDENKNTKKEKDIWDEWILEELRNTKHVVGGAIKNYQFSFAFECEEDGIKDFMWSKLADWYLETSKIKGNNSEVLQSVLEELLKICHPFIPFVTEVIWSKMDKKNLLMVEKVEAPPEYMGSTEKTMEIKFIQDVIKSIRNARAENKVEPAKKIKAIICVNINDYSDKEIKWIKNNENIIKGLRTGINEVETRESDANLKNEICAVFDNIKIYLLGAVDANKEKARLEKEIANLEKFVGALNGKLSNQEFIGKAPEKVVAAEKEKLAKAQVEMEKLKEQFNHL